MEDDVGSLDHRARNGVNETIEILSVNTILFTYRRFSIWPPTNSVHFVYRLIMSYRILGKIPVISRIISAATCIRATRFCCVSALISPLATDGLDVEAQ